MTGAHSMLTDVLREPVKALLSSIRRQREFWKRRRTIREKSSKTLSRRVGMIQDQPTILDEDGWDIEDSLLSDSDFHEVADLAEAENLVTFKAKWRRTIMFCFFLMGIAMNIPFASISLFADYFLEKYNGFTILNGSVTLWPVLLSAYNLPGLPGLLLQLKVDGAITNYVGRIRAYRWRLFSCLCSLLLIILFLGFSQGSRNLGSPTSLIVATTLVGIFQGLAYGWFFQLASLYPFNCTSTLLAGNGMATVVSLLVTLALTNFSLDVKHLPTESVQIYFGCTAICIFIGIVALGFTLTKLNVEGYIGEGKDYEHLLPMSDVPGEVPRQYNWKHSIQIAWPSLLACFIVSVCYVSVTGLLPLTPVAARRDVKNMFTIIMYTSLLSLFVGNEVSVFITCIRSQMVLLCLSIIRAPILPLFIAYDAESFFHNDYFVYLVVFLFILSGAYLNALAYRAGALRDSKAFREIVISFMNISLYCGVYVGLLISYLTPWLLERYFGLFSNAQSQ